MDSLCVTWIKSENRYLVTYLPHDGSPLVKEYVDNMQEFISLLQEVEKEYAT